jgi:uncharacterized membrane protein
VPLSAQASKKEARLEAAPIVLVLAGLQLLLAMVSLHEGWKLWVLPWWAWLALIGPELVLAAYLVRGEDPHQLWLVGIIVVLNVVALVMLIGSILTGQESDGSRLLLKGVTVWATDVVAFGLAFWELENRTADEDDMFEFPSKDKKPSWEPHFFDYFYVSFTNSIAFSPTDAMPLTRRAKLLMFVESALSAVAILLVAARAVNIIK